MTDFCQLINGSIRLKVYSFQKACESLEIVYKESDYTLKPFDPYFSGLIDTDGSIIFNYSSNRIECCFEIKYNSYSSRLNLDYVIPHCKPYVLKRQKSSHKGGKREFKSIMFRFQNVNHMIHLYNFFMKNRLYSDFKFYRVTKIKSFLEIRHYQKYPKNSIEFQVYQNFVLNWIKYLNPLWTKIPFVQTLLTNQEFDTDNLKE